MGRKLPRRSSTWSQPLDWRARDNSSCCGDSHLNLVS